MINKIIQEERFRLTDPIKIKSNGISGNIIAMIKDSPFSHDPEETKYIILPKKGKKVISTREENLTKRRGRTLHYLNRMQDLSIGNFQETICIKTYIINGIEKNYLIDKIRYTTEKDDVLGEKEHNINISAIDLEIVQNFMNSLYDKVTRQILSNNYDSPIEINLRNTQKSTLLHDEIYNNLLTEAFNKEASHEIKRMITDSEKKYIHIKEPFRKAI